MFGSSCSSGPAPPDSFLIAVTVFVTVLGSAPFSNNNCCCGRSARFCCLSGPSQAFAYFVSSVCLRVFNFCTLFRFLLLLNSFASLSFVPSVRLVFSLSLHDVAPLVRFSLIRSLRPTCAFAFASCCRFARLHRFDLFPLSDLCFTVFALARLSRPTWSTLFMLAVFVCVPSLHHN